MQLSAAEYRQRHTATAPAPAKGTPGPPAPVASAVGLRNTPKEVPGAKPRPVQWAVATGEHTRQYGGLFRVVVFGHQNDLAAVLAALETLAPAP